MRTNKDLDALAERIKLRMEYLGLAAFYREELSIVWNHDESLPDLEKILLIKNFALYYGLIVRINDDVKAAIFNRLNEDMLAAGSGRQSLN